MARTTTAPRTMAHLCASASCNNRPRVCQARASSNAFNRVRKSLRSSCSHRRSKSDIGFFSWRVTLAIAANNSSRVSGSGISHLRADDGASRMPATILIIVELGEIDGELDGALIVFGTDMVEVL